jgi:hypothetical protein
VDQIAALDAACLVFHLETADQRLSDCRRDIPETKELHGPDSAFVVGHLVHNTEGTLAKVLLHMIFSSDQISRTAITSLRYDYTVRIGIHYFSNL